MRCATVIIKLTTDCNLLCDYCYERNRIQSSITMTPETILTIYSQFLKANIFESIDFVYHGGEPLLYSTETFFELLEQQRKLRCGLNRHIQIRNCIQTNGILLTDQWIKLFLHFNIDVGVSLDFPPEYHNKIRKSASGSSTFHTIISNMAKLRKEGISDIGVLTVITRRNIDNMKEMYEYFRDRNIPYNLIIYFPDDKPEEDNLIVQPDKLAGALTDLFDIWYFDPDPIRISLFEDIVESFFVGASRSCTYSGKCSDCFGLTPNGDIYICDRFSSPHFRLGNIHTHKISDICHSNLLEAFVNRASMLKDCVLCPWFRYCQGGCPFNSYATCGTIFQRDYFCLTRSCLFSHIYNTLKREEQNETENNS